MKKTMKTMLALVAGALALCACSNDEAIINGNENSSNLGQAGAKLVTLTAYQEGASDTRAAIDGTTNTQINWTAGDKINYFGGGSGEFMTLTGGAGTASGSFSGTVTTGSSDAVLYPYQENATRTGSEIIAEVPMTQYAHAGTFDPKAALMVGEVDGTSIQFKNLMSYVKVTIPTDMTKCKQIAIKAKDEWVTLAGKVTISAHYFAWAETTAKEGQAFVRLVPQSGDYIAPGTYYIAVLPRDTENPKLTYGFEVIYNVDDVIYCKQTQSDSDASKKFVRNRVKDIGTLSTAEASDYTYKVTGTTVLNATGITLKMADRNIGAVSTSDYGDYFAWGALRPAYTRKPDSGTTLTNLYWSGGFKFANAPYYTGNGSTHSWSKYNSTDNKTVLDKEDDIAAMLWGGNWRMATKDEWNKNKLIPSVVGLPLAGVCDGTDFHSDEVYVCYWSSSPSGSKAYYLVTPGEDAYVDSDSRYYGFSVRPVLQGIAEP